MALDLRDIWPRRRSLMEMHGKKSEEREKEEKVLITFLKRIKDGEYAKINKSSLSYPRIKVEREPYYNEEEYYYSLR